MSSNNSDDGDGDDNESSSFDPSALLIDSEESDDAEKQDSNDKLSQEERVAARVEQIVTRAKARGKEMARKAMENEPSSDDDDLSENEIMPELTDGKDNDSDSDSDNNDEYCT